MTKSYVQTDERIKYLSHLATFAPRFGKRLKQLSNKSQRRLTAAAKRQICKCGRKLVHWEANEKKIWSTCATCKNKRELNRFTKKGIDIFTQELMPQNVAGDDNDETCNREPNQGLAPSSNIQMIRKKASNPLTKEQRIAARGERKLRRRERKEAGRARRASRKKTPNKKCDKKAKMESGARVAS